MLLNLMIFRASDLYQCKTFRTYLIEIVYVIFNDFSLSGYRLEQPATNLYAATKHSVRALTEGLRQELRLY